MAEFYPIAEIKTDKEGKASFKTGYGDLLVRAVSGGKWSEVLFKTQDGEHIEFVLDSSEQPSGIVDFDMVPPPEGEGDAASAPPEEKIQAHNRRLEEGTKVRTEYEGTFLSEEEAFTLAQSSGLPPERVWDVLQKPGATAGKSPRSWRSVPANMASGHCGRWSR